MNNENELTAALATIEKCREITNCPAGVDLHGWLKQLAAENVELKEACGGNGSYRNCPACTFSEYIEAPETPATDRIVAAQRSAFVDEAVAKITESGALTFGDCIAALCQLREGANK